MHRENGKKGTDEARTLLQRESKVSHEEYPFRDVIPVKARTHAQAKKTPRKKKRFRGV